MYEKIGDWELGEASFKLTKWGVLYVWHLDGKGEHYYVQLECHKTRYAIFLICDYSKRIRYADFLFVPHTVEELKKVLQGAIMSFIGSRNDGDAFRPKLSVQADEKLQKSYPALYEFLVVDKYDDGSPRETATISISVADDGYKFCLRDRDTSRCLWITATSFFDGLKHLDASLRSQDAPWVKDRFSTNGTPKKGIAKK